MSDVLLFEFELEIASVMATADSVVSCSRECVPMALPVVSTKLVEFGDALSRSSLFDRLQWLHFHNFSVKALYLLHFDSMASTYLRDQLHCNLGLVKP